MLGEQPSFAPLDWVPIVVSTTAAARRVTNGTCIFVTGRNPRGSGSITNAVAAAAVKLTIRRDTVNPTRDSHIIPAAPGVGMTLAGSACPVTTPAVSQLVMLRHPVSP